MGTGNVKAMKRKAKALNLKEKRLRRQRQLPGEALKVLLKEARSEGFIDGHVAGSREVAKEALEIAKSSRSITAVRKALGDLDRSCRREA